MADLSKYRFDKRLTEQSAGGFKAFLKNRYGKELKASEINELVDREYGKSPKDIEVEAEETQ